METRYFVSGAIEKGRSGWNFLTDTSDSPVKRSEISAVIDVTPAEWVLHMARDRNCTVIVYYAEKISMGLAVQLSCQSKIRTYYIEGAEDADF